MATRLGGALKRTHVNRVGWAAVVAAVLIGVTGCGGGGNDGDANGAAAPGGPGPEDSGPITKAKMRLVLDGVTKDTGALPNDPKRAAFPADSSSPLAGCSATYKSYDKAASTVDLHQTNALAAALTGRGWAETKKRDVRKARDGTAREVQAVFKKRGWTIVMDHYLGIGDQMLSLIAFEDACVKKAGGAEYVTPSS
ncbi:hypothetical protein [Streptomyces sp. NPDC056010]|uniref:hypothetical protein n=1 Tax=Streptomyces sp. NPDC056010 TaxID=3345679 RepID=UPI0035D70096